jgi:UDP-2,3-diacylglucosamine pyrophosphatase LpxH
MRVREQQPFYPGATTRWPRKVRTIFASDLHLGAKGSQADAFLDFLRHHEAETYFFVGDMVDGWALKANFHWPQSHNDVLQKILRQGRKGKRIVYIPGNHDEFMREHFGTFFGNVEVAANAIHTAADGKRYFVTHGDQFDVVVGNARWLAKIGGHAYDFAVGLNRAISKVRDAFGLPRWSLAQWLKLRVKDAVSYIGEFEKHLIAEARASGADGVICGHIHHAIIHDRFGMRYVNCGDWMEDCCAVIENDDGTLEVVDWSGWDVVIRSAPNFFAGRAA